MNPIGRNVDDVLIDVDAPAEKGTDRRSSDARSGDERLDGDTERGGGCQGMRAVL